MAKYNFTVGAIESLRQILSLPWGKGIEDTYRGGKILATQLPPFKAGLVLADKAPEIELDGPDRDAIKAALTYGISKESINTTIYLYELIVAFEYVSVPKPPSP